MNKQKPIIFDFDGVIVDSFSAALEVNQMSKPTLTRERYEQVWNGNIADVKYEDKVVKEVNFEKEHPKKFKNLPLIDGIKEIIRILSKDFHLFIISSSTNKTISDYLERHGILDCFTEILGYDIGKSKVKKFKMVFDKYKIDSKETVFITDTAGDIYEAKEAKVGYIAGILGGYQTKESLKKAQPDVIVENFEDFFQVLKDQGLSSK